MRIEIVGTAKTAQAKAGLASLVAETEALNAALKQTTLLAAGATPKSFAQATAGIAASNQVRKNALATTGRFDVQQMKIADSIERNTKLLRSQGLAWNQ
ncbi:MAG TPA: hypothetical protein VIJ87_06405, partial [Pyrinomonadaceae bacterium]